MLLLLLLLLAPPPPSPAYLLLFSSNVKPYHPSQYRLVVEKLSFLQNNNPVSKNPKKCETAAVTPVMMRRGVRLHAADDEGSSCLVLVVVLGFSCAGLCIGPLTKSKNITERLCVFGMKKMAFRRIQSHVFRGVVFL